MKTLLLCLFLPFFLFASSEIKDGVVKIFSTVKRYDYSQPWAPPTISRGTGSGFVIEGNQIITNAHVVANATYIQVRSGRDTKKYEARVKMIGHDCDLALLEVMDPEFFQGKPVLEFSEEVGLQEEEVQVYGFPVGGNELCITRGIVSRIELWRYAYSGEVLLISQIDAPTNFGNSGGPVVSAGKVVGIAHQGNLFGQNIGYMIPIPIIQHFLKEEKENYQGFPTPAFSYQELQNEGLRKFYGLEKESGGLLITGVSQNHYFSDLLERGDILLKIDGFPIDCVGMIYLEEIDLALPFQYLFLMKHYGDEFVLTVLREGAYLEFKGTIDSSKKGKRLVPFNNFEKRPTYYIFGGCVFQPLVGNFFHKRSLPIDLKYHLRRGKVDETKDEVVILSSVCDESLNAGYEGLGSSVIEAVNGEKVSNLKHFVSMIEESQDPFIVIQTADQEEIVFERAETEEKNNEILNRYSIPSDRSDDLK